MKKGMAATCAALAGLLFGFDTVVVSGVTGALRTAFDLSPGAIGFAVSIALWGTLVGALLGGAVGQRFGSRTGLRLSAALYLASALASALAWNIGLLLAGRLVGGLAIGLSSVLAPVYLAEIASAERRGATVGLFQLNIVIGIVLAYLSNALVGAVIAAPMAWRVKLGMIGLPALLFVLALARIPESPRWLLMKGRRGDAANAYASLRGEAMPETMAVTPPETIGGSPWLNLSREAPRAVLLAVAIAGFNQLTGINAVLYYLNDIFASAGFGALSSDIQSITIGCANLLFTLVGMALIDRVGRRPLLLAGSIGMIFALIGAALVMAGRLTPVLLLPILVLFIASFAASQGAVIWVYISELFPNRFRATGQAVGSATVWLFDALVAQIFPLVAEHSRALPFVIFAGIMLVQLVVVALFFPETKGVALEDMERRIRDDAVAAVAPS